MDLVTDESNEYFWQLIAQIDLDHDVLSSNLTEFVFEEPELNSIQNKMTNKIREIHKSNSKLLNNDKKVCLYIQNPDHRIGIKQEIFFANKIGKLIIVNNVFNSDILNQIIRTIKHKESKTCFKSLEENAKFELLIELIRQKSKLNDPIIDLTNIENNNFDRLILHGLDNNICACDVNFLAKIIDVLNVKKLTLILPNITRFSQIVFVNFPNLKTLFIQTPLLIKLNETSLNSDNLVCLNISHSNLCSIENGTFKFLRNLKWLILTSNKIELLKKETFVDLSKLEYLVLNRNVIKKIESNCFISLRDLKLLDLSENKLSLLDNNTFNGLESLIILNLNNNRSNLQIENQVFSPCIHLQVLDLANNSIKSLEPIVFDKCNRIRFLTIRNNTLQNLNFINNLTELEYLQLFGNEMKNLIHSLALIEISSLKFIELVCNKVPVFGDNFNNLQALKISCVNEFENDCFKNLKNLEYLKLHFEKDSAIKNLDENNFNGINNLKYFKIETGHFDAESIKIFYEKEKLFLSLFDQSSSNLKHVVDYFGDDYSYTLGAEILDCESEDFYFKNKLNVSEYVRKAIFDLQSYSSYYKSYVDQIPLYEPNEFSF